ncbi:regulatory iron-sulfur-containing complex subunit RicT [uncultured Duncaniella sp.]|uniref:PSP1 domain-containing protein n=2 Tax=uncultured Duncaniella sp. TaxID=2768039 RepID=UPI0026097E46|nr:regulatory iron-sulfur-containing complex subunit RicT [uncultured Duncaniella sp.]
MEEKDRRCPRGKLHCCNWLEDIPGGMTDFDIVEVQFKNTRKGFYRNSINLDLAPGDVVAVEASPGHDIGTVTLTGKLVALQMRRANVKPDAEIRRVFRKAKPADIDKYEEAKARENDTMIRARKIAESLHLNMKIGDVEYQGDGNKAIFYYIADERVDFRQLIKVLAETFKVRIEMKQIGARQEAGRIGGIGSCGRPLCCASWMTNFVSVGTSAARYQDISLNPQKLAGQCAKLKCCLNFEVDTYVESSKQMPGREIRLETLDNTYYHFKTDIFKKQITYSTDKQIPANLVTIDAERAFEVIEMNRRGEKPAELVREGEPKPGVKPKPIDLASQDDLTRFDKAKKKKRKKKPAAGNAPQQDGQAAPSPKQGQKGEQPRKNEQPKGQQPKADDSKGEQPKNGEQAERKPRPKKPKKPQDGGGQKREQGAGGDNQQPQQPRQQNVEPQQPRPNRIPKAFRDNKE